MLSLPRGTRDVSARGPGSRSVIWREMLTRASHWCLRYPRFVKIRPERWTEITAVTALVWSVGLWAGVPSETSARTIELKHCLSSCQNNHTSPPNRQEHACKYTRTQAHTAGRGGSEHDSSVTRSPQPRPPLSPHLLCRAGVCRGTPDTLPGQTLESSREPQGQRRPLQSPAHPGSTPKAGHPLRALGCRQRQHRLWDPQGLGQELGPRGQACGSHPGPHATELRKLSAQMGSHLEPPPPRPWATVPWEVVPRPLPTGQPHSLLRPLSSSTPHVPLAQDPSLHPRPLSLAPGFPVG